MEKGNTKNDISDTGCEERRNQNADAGDYAIMNGNTLQKMYSMLSYLVLKTMCGSNADKIQT